MGFAEGYILFMISVGLWACYELMLPTLRELNSLGRQDDVLLRNRFISYSTMFCIAAVLAPLLLLIILVPRLNKAAVMAMVERDD